MKVCRLPMQPTVSPTNGLYIAGNAATTTGLVGGMSDTYGAKRYFLAVIVLGDSTKSVSTVTVNVSGLAPQPAARLTTFTANSRKIEVWGLTNPLVIGNITITFSGATDYVAWIETLFGVHQDAAVGAFVTASGTSTAPTASVSDSEDYALSFLATASESVTRAAGTDVAAFEPGVGYASKTTGATNPCSLDVGEIRFCREGVATALPWTLSSSVAWLEVVIAIHRHGRPTANYRAWRDGTAADRTVLVEIEPGEQLTGFALVSGSYYSVSFASSVQASINGGIRRKLIGVEENGTPYVELASAAAVSTTASSYFLDTTTNLLYVRTSSGSSPNTFAAITATFRIHLATREVDFVGGEYYEPRLIGALPTTRMEAQDLLFGITIYPGGEIGIQNTDGLFDALSVTWLWRNRKARAFLGGLALARVDYKQQSEMLIEDLQTGLSVAVAKLRAGADVLQVLTPTRLASAQMSFSPNIDGAASAYEPIVFGQVVNYVPQAWRDFGGGTVDYIAGDSFYLPVVTGCRAISRATGVSTELARSTQWQTSVSQGLHVTDATYGVIGDYEIRCDITGFTYGAIGSPTFGSLCLALLQYVAQVSAEEIDRESFKRADAYSPRLAWIQAERITVAELVRLFEKSSFSQLSAASEGFWAASFWAPCDPDFDLLPELADENLQADPQPEPAPSTPLYEMVVNYARQIGPDTWSTASSSSVAVIGTHRTRRSQSIDTAIDNSFDATILADRYRAIQNAPTKALRFIENGFSLIEKGIFDRFLLTMARAPSSTGSYARALHELTDVSKSLNPPAIEEVAGNMQGLGNYARCAAPDALVAVTYTAATADQKARYGFAGDDATERADASDPTSYAQARAW